MIRRYPRTALSWLGRRIELNRAAIIAAALALGCLLAGLIYVERREAAGSADRREEIAAVVRDNSDAIARIERLEQPTAGNVRALIRRYLREELARRRALRTPPPLVRPGPTVGGGGRSGTSPPSSPPAPREPQRGPAGEPGAPGAPGAPAPAPAPSPEPAPPPSPLEPLEEILERLLP